MPPKTQNYVYCMNLKTKLYKHLTICAPKAPSWCFCVWGFHHYNDVIMGTVASQITSLTIVYSTVYSDADQRKHQSSASLAFCAGNSLRTREFPAQMASYTENVSIWWHHHDGLMSMCPGSNSVDKPIFSCIPVWLTYLFISKLCCGIEQYHNNLSLLICLY